MKTEDVKKRYSNGYDERVVEYMNQIIDSLVAEYGSVKDEWIISLDTMAQNQNIYLVGYDDFMANGPLITDQAGRIQRNPAITLVLNTQAYNQKLLNAFGLTIMSKSKLKGSSSDIDTGEAFIDDLVK